MVHRHTVSKHLAALAWLALFALTLLPTLTRVVNAATPGVWTQVCSAQGMRWLAPDGTLSERSPGGQLAAHGEHCPMCGSAAVVVPPAELLPTLAEHQAHFVAPLFKHAPRLQFAWSRAQPRAPPLVA